MMIQKSEYKKRQKNLFKLFAKETGLVVLYSPALSIKQGDEHFPFYQDNNILYLTGVDLVGTAVVLNQKTKKVTLYAPKPTIFGEIWAGKQSTYAELKKRYPVDSVADIQNLPTLVKKYKTVHSLPRLNGPIKKYVSDKIAYALLKLRLVKSKEEIKLIKRSCLFTQKSYNLIQKLLLEKKTPAVMKANLDYHFARNGFKHAFNPIITTNGSVLHNDMYTTRLEKNKLLLVDMGAKGFNYASDFTRTIPTGKINRYQKDILTLVRSVKEQTIQFVRPGLLFKEVHDYAVSLIVDALLNLGLLVGKKEAIIKVNAHQVFFPHGIGHHLGLDTHDCSELLKHFPKKTQPIPLSKGMVITVEPGVYFVETYMKNISAFPKWKPFVNIALARKYATSVSGVRDEDTIFL